MTWAGLAKLALGAHKEAIERLRHAVEMNCKTAPAHFFLAAALARVGALDEARRMAQAGLALDPAYTIRRYRAGASSDKSLPIWPSARERPIACAWLASRTPEARQRAFESALVVRGEVALTANKVGSSAPQQRDIYDVADPLLWNVSRFVLIPRANVDRKVL